MHSETEKKIAQLIQRDIPVEKRLFLHIGKQAGVPEEEVIETIRELKRTGVIRRFGAIVRHQKAGLTANAMVVWSVPEERTEAVGAIVSSFREVSHCYERIPPFEGKYNLFAMMHLKNTDSEKLIQEILNKTGMTDYKILETEEEFKKSSMEYF